MTAINASRFAGLLSLVASVAPGWAANRPPDSNPMFQAIRAADRAGLVKLLSDTGLLDVRDDSGNTPLILAAHLGNLDSVRLLIEAGADPNATNKAGVTALLRAAADPRKVTLLLEHGANPNILSEMGHSPLMLAARSPGNSEAVRLLLRHGANVNAKSLFGATPLMAGAAASDFETVRLLVEHGAQVNAAPMPESAGIDPLWGGLRTALMWAAYRGNERILTYLIDHGADVNNGSPFGTPLSHTAWSGTTGTAQRLLDRGARVDQTEPFSGFTPLHWAAASEEGKSDLLELLLQRGANPNAEGGQPVEAFLGVPQTPLLLARKRGETHLAQCLVNAGATAPMPASSEPATQPPLASEPDARAVWNAMARAAGPLQQTALKSRESFLHHASRQECVSCHQQYFPMAAVGMSQGQRIPVDRAAESELIQTVLKVHRGAERDAEPLFHPEPTHTYGYALIGLRAEGVIAPEVTDPFVHHLAVIQNLDGHWDLNMMRPPLQSTDLTSTALSVFALRHFGWPARADEFEERIHRAREWLARVEAKTHEARTYQLLGLHWAGVPSNQLTEKVEALIALQRQDGGWSQLPGLPSDAYATGQALYTLHQAGGLRSENAACRRAIRYLLATQGSDGTWHVRRRAFPFQPTMESGFPYGRDGWISATGTSWAVMALSLMFEASPDELTSLVRSRGASSEVTDGAENISRQARQLVDPAETSPVDFARDIQPLLERSCVACHSGDRPKGGYRLTTRAAFLSPGNLGRIPVVPGHSDESPFVRFVSGLAEDLEMPPLEKRGRFPALDRDEIERLRRWINQGAPWPETIVLGKPLASSSAPQP